MRDWLVTSIASMLYKKKGFWEIKRSLKSLGLDICKQSLLNRLKHERNKNSDGQGLQS